MAEYRGIIAEVGQSILGCPGHVLSAPGALEKLRADLLGVGLGVDDRIM